MCEKDGEGERESEGRDRDSSLSRVTGHRLDDRGSVHDG